MKKSKSIVYYAAGICVFLSLCTAVLAEDAYCESAANASLWSAIVSSDVASVMLALEVGANPGELCATSIHRDLRTGKVDRVLPMRRLPYYFSGHRLVNLIKLFQKFGARLGASDDVGIVSAALCAKEDVALQDFLKSQKITCAKNP